MIRPCQNYVELSEGDREHVPHPIFLRFILPEHRHDAQRLLLLDQARQIVAQEFAQDFVGHRRVGLAHDVVSEFSLNRRERALDVRSLVIMAHVRMALPSRNPC